MAEDVVLVEDAPPPEEPRRRPLLRRVLRWLGIAFAALLVLIAIAIAWLHTSSGRDFIVDRIAKVAPASGLKIEVGSIEGSVLWSATLHDVKFRDANDTLFLEVPEVDLNWRPLKFFVTGLDVRHLVLRGGTLYAAPELLPGDPDAPILPDFDIRVDRFVVEDLRIAEGVLGEERMIDFAAKADVRDGRLLIDADGQFGGGDELEALIDAYPDGDKFDIDVDYRAPAGGLLATLMGADEDVRARILGDGRWSAWNGSFVATQGGDNIVALRLYNRDGRYKVVGQARPGEYLSGLSAAALGDVVSVAGVGTLEDSVLDGTLAIRGRGVSLDGEGAIDLGDNRFDELELQAVLLDNELFGPGLTVDDAIARVTLDGGFRELSAPLEVSVGELNAGGTRLIGIVERGTVSYDGSRWTLPLDATVKRIASGNAMVDPRLVNGTLRGTLVMAGDRLMSDDLALRFPGLRADLTLRGDMNRGGYALAGPVEARGLTVENLGTVDAGGQIRFSIGNGVPWRLVANFTGRMPRVTNATLANVAGSNIRFNGAVALGAARPIAFDNLHVTASKLSLTLDGRVENGRTTLAGNGRHVEYGAFTVEAAIADDGPRATLVFANPYPAAGLRNVRVALAPTRNGFGIDTEGQSMLGPFDGLINLTMPARGPTRIGIERLDVWRTTITGDLTLGDRAVAGTLRLAGGGVNGSVLLAPRGGGQGFDVALTANNATFRGPTPLSINQATVNVSGFFGQGNSTITGSVRAAGINYGTMFIGRLAANAEVRNGRGTFQAALSGRRGSRFNLQLSGDVAPNRIAVAARGDYAGRKITMPRRAVLLKTTDGGWALQQTQLSFGRGFLIAEGRFGGRAPMQGKVSLSQMPLSLLDVFAGDVGLGGTVSGIVDFGSGPNGVPIGEARVMVDNLTRSGLVMSSRPMDLALVARLSATQLQARAVLQDEGQTKGRLQARISGLPASGPLAERLYAGDLFAQLRFEGPADALWRLSAIELIDVTGTLRVAADVTGSLRQPRVRGSIAGDALGVQSPLTGTVLNNVRARGTFSGSRLNLTSFAGATPNGGRISGSGFVDLSNMTRDRGPRMDLRMAARNAEVVDLVGMGATVTGPIRIVSSGMGGTIAGRLHVNEARWRLGMAAADQRLPNIPTREINLPPDRAPPRAPGQAWRYLIDADAPGGIEVDGMGLDSEWSANVQLRGTADAPRITGEANVVPRQGFYSFAGVRFEIVRGEIDFYGNSPPDPRINIRAETEVNDLSVAVTVTGNASQPMISFSSNPSLPEEELLARMLFGDGISNLSATDALQLGAAVASLRGGGGMDPINRLRTSIGLDRLRIIPADPALERGTAIALGKNFGRRFYGELITDGRGYSATSLEFRVTSWLSILAAIDTRSRGSLAGEYRKDY
jgi:translocation and assembly module TamB